MNLAEVAPDYAPNGRFDPNPEASELLGYFAWTVTAAAVAGVIIIGTQMALQLRRGEMGEGATYFRGMVLVLGACILCISAGPLVNYVIFPYLIPAAK
ncbi:hypothetical protein ACIREO_19535 [Streptomyces sp. NPDC102441]|uniref:hypothetical protein n=1 Tax=Streptomyces sp. NPDC102441 TaxID=3366176 RepID=UPI0038171B22